jgi:stage II sporulation protein AA (anti-sigma F factor antagonist)
LLAFLDRLAYHTKEKHYEGKQGTISLCFPFCILLKGEKMDTFELKKGCLIIHIRDELDHHRAVELRREADKRLDKENAKNIIFDFEGVPFMDSSGIGMVMGRYKKVIFTGGRAFVTGVGPGVDRIFRISGLYKIIEKYDSIESAIEAL